MSTQETFHRSLWSALTPPRPALVPVESGAADAVVVGGGLLGLSVALGLARAGVDVLVLEATEIGFGASGRNTGFVVPALKGSLGPDEAARLVGRVKAEELLRFVSGAGQFAFDLMREHGMACSAEQTGVLQPAPHDAALRMVERQVRRMAALGIAIEALDAAETERQTGMRGYRGAMRLPTGGQINPLAYAAGLADAVRAAGGRLRHGRVARIERQGLSWRVDCVGGASITTAKVVLATNALVGRLAPTVARSVLPARSYQVATEPLDDTIRAHLLPGRQPLVDLRNHPFALRWSPDNRLITGGGAIFHGGDAVGRMSRFLLRRLRRLVPDLPPLAASHAWFGLVAGTGDFMPRVWSLGPGLVAPIGCNGRGVALTSALGHAIGRYLLNDDAHILPVPVTAPHPWRLHGAMRFAPSAWLAQARFRDWRNERRAM